VNAIHRPAAGGRSAGGAAAARKWASGHLLGKSNPRQEWGVIHIETAGLKGRVYRDPASSTGYMLEDKRIEGRLLLLVDRFRHERP
jgi:hypothetical protein